jgi:hypothetical protein
MSRVLLVRLRHGSKTLHRPMFLEAGFYSNLMPGRQRSTVLWSGTPRLEMPAQHNCRPSHAASNSLTHYFVRIVEGGSFSRAAATIHVAQSPLSRQIASNSACSSFSGRVGKPPRPGSPCRLAVRQPHGGAVDERVRRIDDDLVTRMET